VQSSCSVYICSMWMSRPVLHVIQCCLYIIGKLCFLCCIFSFCIKSDFHYFGPLSLKLLPEPAHKASVYPSFCCIKQLGVSLPLDGILVHGRLATQFRLVPIYTPGCRHLETDMGSGKIQTHSGHESSSNHTLSS
jgi:hypothetical protein